MVQGAAAPVVVQMAGKSRSRLWIGQVQTYTIAATVQEATPTVAAPPPAHRPQGH